MKLTKFNVLTLLMLLFIAACSPPKTESTSISVTADAVGPFFMGVNSLTADYQVELSSLVEAQNLDPKKLKEVKLTSIKIQLTDDAGMEMVDINSASLQIVSDNVEMTSIAVKNPINEEGLSTNLNVSEEAEISEYFKQDYFTLVLDLDFKDDSYVEELAANLEIDLEISYKE